MLCQDYWSPPEGGERGEDGKRRRRSGGGSARRALKQEPLSGAKAQRSAGPGLRYKALATTTVREKPKRDAQAVAKLEPDQIVQSLEERNRSDGSRW
eukprot:COSAG02_NODE_17718_length_985_cov_1.617381_1_plen_96_part_10